MTYKEAVSIAKRKEPELKCILVTEQEDQFLLLMGDKNGNLLMNTSVLVVKKNTGKCGWVNTLLHYKEVNKPILREYEL